VGADKFKKRKKEQRRISERLRKWKSQKEKEKNLNSSNPYRIDERK